MDHKEQQLASPAGHDASVVAQLEEKVAHYIKQVKELEAKVGRALITFYTRSNKQAYLPAYAWTFFTTKYTKWLSQ